MSTVKLEKRSDGVGMIFFDTPDSKVNILSRSLFDEFSAVLDEVERDDAIRACVLASGKPGTFIAGANLVELRGIDNQRDGAAFSANGQRLLDRIATGRKPFVAAIDGPALGGGLEVALACHYIVASDSPKTVLALPEVMLGLLPGGGGTQRLPRRVGLPEALPLMLTGKRLRPKRALRMGLVDAVTSPGGIAETAARAAVLVAEGKLRRRKPKRSLVNRWLERPPLRAIVFRQARAQVARRTRGNYPAPPCIIDCVETGWSRGMKAGLERESQLFGELTAGPVAKNLIGLFDAMNEMKKPAGDAEPRSVRRLGVLGGGFMGSGIAAVSVPLMPVTVKDISDEVLAKCAASVKEGLDRRVRSRAISRFDRDRQMARLHLSTEDTDLAHADLIVEAVFEDLELKRKILAATEEVIEPETVFASNTSALPITEIAAKARHPERVLGMHYFSPVPKMPLLEIIVTDTTADWALATAREIGIRQGKTVIVVRDGPGFYTSRILSPYLGEAIILLEQGARVEQIDRALKDFGYPVGPMALLDEVGIDVAAHVARNFGALYAHRGLGGSEAFGRLHEAGFAGRKNKRGFYRYDGPKKGKGKQVNEEVYAVVGGAPRRTFPAEEIVSRLALLMVNEAAYCLQEEVIASERDGDVGAILGLGFPPFRGGPFAYVRAEGARSIVERMERLRDAHGPRFQPAPLLRDLVQSGA
jgi:3-hydroxyacyl-CoA dehydrogenase/enoyl-CoA hydratase/3-hydroxybutyryl-CoA epimerase